MTSSSDVPLHALSAVEAAAGIRARRISSRALVEACLHRIEVRDPVVKAWALVDRAGALAAADRLDTDAASGRFQGPLHGVPVGVKDIFHVAGVMTRAGARGFADVLPDVDAVSVARLRAAGAVILGKLHTTEFAFADPAPTTNPWNPSHTPGGSSAGSAAAVAARMIPLALGTQTVGSTIRPAAFCGTVGFKPTYGSISRRGIVAAAWSLDHVGVFGRTVADTALAWSILVDRRDPRGTGDHESQGDAVPGQGPSARAPRLGIVREPFLELAEPGMQDHFEAIVRLLSRRGAVMEAVRLTPILPAFLSAIQVLIRAEAAAQHADRYREHAARYRPRIRAALEAGMCIPAALYLRAQRIRRQARRELEPLLQSFDALLMPAARGAAPDLTTTGDPGFSAPWSGIGAPQIALPTGLADGLPLGIQLIGAPGTEPRLLAAARWMEAIVGLGGGPADPSPTGEHPSNR